MSALHQIFLFAFERLRKGPLFDAYMARNMAARRGTGKDLTKENCLLYGAGHVGIAFTHDGPIWGFNPQIESGKIAETLELLKGGASVPGVVTDDTAIFHAARKRKLEVLCIEYSYSEAEYDSIQANFAQEQESSRYEYRFPKRNGGCNCATWPKKLGCRIPEETGVMKLYMDAVRTMIAARMSSKTEAHNVNR